MNEPLSEELLSAYLDGELTGEEQARVEEWLTASPSHRRLFDDLRLIRRELQALPPQSLDAGFSDRVLAAIREHQAKSGKPEVVSPAADTTGSGIVAEGHQPTTKDFNRAMGMPGWRWFVAGVAASLVAVMVGVNAAPETMSQIGFLPPVRLVNVVAERPQPPVENRNRVATAKPAEVAPRNVLVHEDTSDNKQVEPPAAPLQQRTLEAGPRKSEQSLERAGLAEAPARGFEGRAELQQRQLTQQEKSNNAGAAPPVAPSVVADAMPVKGMAGGQGLVKQGDEAKHARRLANEVVREQLASVVELPVTSQQAEMAFAAAEDQNAVLQNNTYFQANRATLRKSAGSSEEESTEEAAKAASVTKDRYAPDASGVQISALEVTGTESEVHSLLDSLGVAAARNLRPIRLNDQSESAAQYASGGFAGATPNENEGVAAGFARAKAADGADKQFSAPAAPLAAGNAVPEKPGAPVAAKADGGGGRGNADRESAAKPALAKSGAPGNGQGAGGNVKRDSAAADKRSFGAKFREPQLRVRLVVVPPTAANPIGPTIEVKPAEAKQ
jgi:anti-sigma factor RsiW